VFSQLELSIGLIQKADFARDFTYVNIWNRVGAPEQTLLKLLDYLYTNPNELNLPTFQMPTSDKAIANITY